MLPNPLSRFPSDKFCHIHLCVHLPNDMVLGRLPRYLIFDGRQRVRPDSKRTGQPRLYLLCSEVNYYRVAHYLLLFIVRFV